MTKNIDISEIVPTNAETEDFFKNMTDTVNSHPLVLPVVEKFVEQELEKEVKLMKVYEDDKKTEADEKDIQGVDLDVITDDGIVSIGNRVRSRKVKGYWTGLSMRADKGDVFSSDKGFIHRADKIYGSEVAKILNEDKNYADYILMSRKDDKGLIYSVFLINTQKMAEMIEEQELNPQPPTRRTPAGSQGGRQAFYFDLADMKEAIEFSYNYIGNEEDGYIEEPDNVDKQTPSKDKLKEGIAQYLQANVQYSNADELFKTKLIQRLSDKTE